MPYGNAAKDRAYRIAYRRKNRKRLAQQERERRRANPEICYAANIRRLFGLTLAAYHAMREQQKNRCAICRRLQSGRCKRLAVDHDHKTKRIRALLCSRCNRALGLLRDNISLVRKALAYLEKHEKAKRTAA